MATPYQLGQNSGLAQSTIENIRLKAESNQAMQTPTPEKQAVYDAYQAQYTDKIKQQAQAGTGLVNANEWKQSIYDQHAQQAQGQQGAMSIDQYMQQAQQGSASQMQAMQQFLQNSAQAQISSQQAQLGQARDQQLMEIERALQKAISDGQLSIRQAEQQFAQAKQEIENQAYLDSERTNLTAHDRGIQNSAQMIGLMQGDQARQQGLMNQNMSQRDVTINEINHQLNQLNYDAGINRSMANNQYNYGLAGAMGEINANMYNQLASMSFEDYQRLQSQGFDMNMLGMQHQNDLSKMAQAQQYTQQNMQTQQGFDLSRLSVQQRYTLEQMAKQQGFDLDKMSADQQYRLAQMAQSFDYDMRTQESTQGFQADQNALDRGIQVKLQEMRQSHDLNMLTKEQQADLDRYEVELGRKLAQYQPGTREYDLLNSEFDFAIESLKRESMANLATDIGAKKLASLLESYPEMPKDMSDRKAIESYNARVEAINKQITDTMDGKGFQYTMDTLQATKKYDEKQKASWLDAIKAGIKTLPLPGLLLPR